LNGRACKRKEREKKNGNEETNAKTMAFLLESQGGRATAWEESIGAWMWRFLLDSTGPMKNWNRKQKTETENRNRNRKQKQKQKQKQKERSREEE
jgi:hypothetical protein